MAGWECTWLGRDKLGSCFEGRIEVDLDAFF